LKKRKENPWYDIIKRKLKKITIVNRKEFKYIRMKLKKKSVNKKKSKKKILANPSGVNKIHERNHVNEIT
jgi:hypothetical protein